RLRTLHERLAELGLALEVYPSNLGGTLAGWFATGGIGLNAFVHGRALDSVLAADLLLPSGEHLRFHADGRLDVPDGPRRRTLAACGRTTRRARGGGFRVPSRRVRTCRGRASRVPPIWGRPRARIRAARPTSMWTSSTSRSRGASRPRCRKYPGAPPCSERR